MCGRFTLRTPMGVLVEQFAVKTDQQLNFRFNIAPTQLVPAIRASGSPKDREFAMLRWGLIPSWAKDPSIGNRMINARADGVADKPSFRSAFKKRRCLIVADGYYEWKKLGKNKQPYWIHMRDGQPFAFAGLWEQWRGDGSGDALESCTIITTDANEGTKCLHDRMPVILEPCDYDLWLDPQVDDRNRLEPLLKPYCHDDLTADPVSPHVNSPTHDDPKCIEPITLPAV